MTDDRSADAYGSDDIWDVWAESSITFHLDGGRVLEVGIDPLPWVEIVHVVTAWNPGRAQSRDENDAANLRLLADLRQSGLPWCRAIGASPDGSWAEAGFAVAGLGRDRAVELGRRYGQMGIYEIDGDDVIIVDCDTTHTLPTRIGRRPAK